MQGISIAWGYALWMINMACGAMIVQHAVCNLSRWKYSIRSLALWGNALLLGGGLRVLLAFGAHENPGFGEVLINLGVALLSVRSMRRFWIANHPKRWAYTAFASVVLVSLTVGIIVDDFRIINR